MRARLAVARVNDVDLQADCGSRRCYVFRHVFEIRVGGIDQQSDAGGCGEKIVQQTKLLCAQLCEEGIYPSRIAARSDCNDSDRVPRRQRSSQAWPCRRS